MRRTMAEERFRSEHLLDGIGPAIRLLRKRKGLTQYRVAEIAGLNKNLLSHWETGTTSPSLPNLAKAMEVLDVNLLDLHNAIQLLQGKAIDQPSGHAVSVPLSAPGAALEDVPQVLERASAITLEMLRFFGAMHRAATQKCVSPGKRLSGSAAARPAGRCPGRSPAAPRPGGV